VEGAVLSLRLERRYRGAEEALGKVVREESDKRAFLEAIAKLLTANSKS
jgi:hypothetical protein